MARTDPSDELSFRLYHNDDLYRLNDYSVEIVECIDLLVDTVTRNIDPDLPETDILSILRSRVAFLSQLF